MARSILFREMLRVASKHFVDWVERHGLRMRRRLALLPAAPLDPFLLAQTMQVPVITPHDIIQLDANCLAELLGSGARSWSGGSLHLPDGRAVVVLNPTHAATRNRATLMEELVHIDLQHPPSQIMRSGGLTMRSYNKTNETQAYWIGTAALVTRQRLQMAERVGATRESVANECGVSRDLVKFREQVTGIRL